MSAPTLPAAIGSATVAEIREMLGGQTGNTDMALLRRVFAWGRMNGWSAGWSGLNWQSKDQTVGVEWVASAREIGVSRRNGRTWMPIDWYPVTSVRQAIDILVIEGVLPVSFSSMYAAGRADRAAGGEQR